MIRFALIFAIFCSMSMADTLQLRDGSSVGGNWLGADAQKVRFLVNDQVQNYNRSDVIAVSFGDGAVTPAPAQSIAPPPPPAATRIESIVEGVRFTMERCERNGTESLHCAFTVEALRTDIEIHLSAGSFMVDSNGIQQRSLEVTLGSGRSAYGNPATTLLVQNVPTRGDLQFKGVDPQVNRVALVNFVWAATNGGEVRVVLRNVPITGN